MKWAGILGLRLCAKIEPSPEDKGIVKKVDKFWYYLKKRSKKFWIFKAWIFKACDRAGKRLIDWEFGDRSRQTFKRRFERLKKWKILFY
ncbi:IS1 transposase [Holospora undulata]|uniref:IS1 transposase n=1 Tax=Holospora undulata TaxID=1169117 RepID=UPI00032D7A02|nr:IS1 transposase [Holospora undulata]